ncbi:uncharacterized protein LOC134206838 [Armigeres subalbatus]|uniref:uncharacterized protein LOC134206838 n=1 Tax=Armigeres subalbatus TaxID=124917 RepID=UPI002ED0B7D3
MGDGHVEDEKLATSKGVSFGIINFCILGENHRLPRLFRIIPVMLHGNNVSIETFAFLDEGSDLTMVEEDLAAKLGVKGTPYPLCLRWTGDASRMEKGSQQITLDITGIDQRKRYKLINARTVENLSLPSQSFQMEEAAKRHPHLKGIPISSYQNAKPRILIGIDNLRLAVPLKTREGVGSVPVAVKTRLGWCVYGPRGNNERESYSFHVRECDCNENLHGIVKEFFDIECTGVVPTINSLTKEEERALTILETTTRRVGQHFETGLLWKEDQVEFPNSYLMALRRLECLERRMERETKLKESLHRQIREYEEKGYAHKVTQTELEAADPRKMWYLPIGAVVNPKKPEKVRIIWDAAAKVDDVSLNSKLLKGPDLLSSLPGVLFRFRLYWIAVTSDIQEMFHQLRIREEDKVSQLFLWRTNPSDKPTVYVMDVATFGSTCSPASAQFAKNRNAEQHSELFPEAAKAIVHDHYVDDYLASFSSPEEAAKVASGVRHVHSNGGFKLHNWRSNCDAVLNNLGEAPHGAEKQLIMAETAKTERILGMLWNPTTDELSFSTHMSNEVQTLIRTATRPTKRQVLRCVMALFDPLGILSPFIIHGKVLIQDLWREGTEWDEQVSDQVYLKWKRWIQMIEYIADIRIPRCYFRRANASEGAYACAVYLRTVDEDGHPQCCLIGAKSKVAPLKPWSIPRLELQACVLSTRWSKFIKENLEVPVKYFNDDSKWFRGPNFLYMSNEEWPYVETPGIATVEEIRTSILHHTTIQPAVCFERFSSWERLVRVTAYVLRFLRNTSRRQAKIKGPLQHVELRAAEENIIKLVQKSYPEEVAALVYKSSNETAQQVIEKNSRIYKLVPVLDENGLLRERGRIGAVQNISYDVQHL